MTMRERSSARRSSGVCCPNEERREMEKPRLAIMLNNAGSNDPCAICRSRTDPEVGPELFLYPTMALVCYDCGREHAPELVDALFSYRASAHGE
jgi:hypothetical protein